MGKITKVNMPHPFLKQGYGDYIETCSFHTLLDINNIKPDMEAKKYIIPIQYSLECDSLNRLIEQEKAVCVAKIWCALTCFSDIIEFEKNKQETQYEVSLNNIANNIKIKGLIIAKDNLINPFDKNELDPDLFNSIDIKVEKYSYLAESETTTLSLSHPEPISSIFYIQNGGHQEKTHLTNYEGDKIIIDLDENTFKEYDISDKNMNLTIPNISSLRAEVTGAIDKIKDYFKTNEYNKPEFEDTPTWFRVIYTQSLEKGIDLECPYMESADIADILLDNCTAKTYKILNNLSNMGMDYDEGGLI